MSNLAKILQRLIHEGCSVGPTGKCEGRVLVDGGSKGLLISEGFLLKDGLGTKSVLAKAGLKESVLQNRFL